jgi:hypothetical protein
MTVCVFLKLFCKSTNLCSFLPTGIGLAQGLLARGRASPNLGAIQRPQRRMVISHQMTRKMTELCDAYVSCLVYIKVTMDVARSSCNLYFAPSYIMSVVYSIHFMIFLPTSPSLSSFEIIIFFIIVIP